MKVETGWWGFFRETVRQGIKADPKWRGASASEGLLLRKCLSFLVIMEPPWHEILHPWNKWNSGKRQHLQEQGLLRRAKRREERILPPSSYEAQDSSRSYQHLLSRLSPQNYVPLAKAASGSRERGPGEVPGWNPLMFFWWRLRAVLHCSESLHGWVWDPVIPPKESPPTVMAQEEQVWVPCLFSRICTSHTIHPPSLVRRPSVRQHRLVVRHTHCLARGLPACWLLNWIELIKPISPFIDMGLPI